MISENALRVLTEDECWFRLAENDLGRLVVTVHGETDVYPVNYTTDAGSLFIRTAPGNKLVELTVQPSVVFEIDHVDDSAGYSVVVKGTARELQHQSEIDRADELPLTPILPTLKYRWIRVIPTSVSGRAFVRGPEPDRY